jgi:hypothetical protein
MGLAFGCFNEFWWFFCFKNCMWIVAMAGYNELPFKIDDIIEIYQTDFTK